MIAIWILLKRENLSRKNIFQVKLKKIKDKLGANKKLQQGEEDLVQ